MKNVVQVVIQEVACGQGLSLAQFGPKPYNLSHKHILFPTLGTLVLS